MTTSSQLYAGDISVRDAWSLLAKSPAAQLIDVRTVAEWSFVGIPDLSDVGRETHLVEWLHFPDMELNGRFLAEATSRIGSDTETPVLVICRSGTRSRAAAIALTEAGYNNSFNIAGGFEGDLDAHGHRGTINGWKAAGLPWKQT